MSEWPETPLGDVIDVFDSIRVPLSAAERATRKGPYPYYGAQGIIDSVDGYLFDGRYLLIPEDGENLNSRKLPIAYFADGRFWVNNHAHIIRGKAGKLDDVFLKHVLNARDIAGYITGAAQPKLTQANLKRIVIALPNIETQRRIASILGAYDDLIEVNRRRIAVLEEMARGLFEEWFIRFRFPGHEAVPIEDTPDGPLPKGWTLEALGALADIQWGDTSTTKKSYTPNGFRAYSASGPDGFMPKFDSDRVGVILSAIGAQCGKTWLARGQWSCIKNTMRFWARAGGVGTEYLYLALSAPDKWPKRGAAQPFISLGDARKIKILQPAKNISTRFEASVAPMLELTDTLALQNECLAAARDLLLPRLISGQLSVTQAERDVEEAA